MIMTKEKEKEFRIKLEDIKTKRGPLMLALQDAQAIFGCVPIEVQKIISQELRISVAKINGVVTFYSQFSIHPKGENIVSVCMGTACYVRGSQVILNKAEELTKCKPGKTSSDGKYSLVATRCVGACGLAPVVGLNEEVHGNVVVSDVENILRGDDNE